MKTEEYLRSILAIVSEECGESIEDIRSDCRRVELVQCRMLYAAVAWKLLQVPLRQIGRPIRRCVSSVQGMILNHQKASNRLYLALYRRVKERAEQEIFEKKND